MKPNSANHNPEPRYLRGLREQVGLTQKGIAELFGVSRRMVQYYEADEGEASHRPAPYLYQFALERLAMGWRSIDSAPKDGTRILVCRNELIEPVTIGYWSMAECKIVTPLVSHYRKPLLWTPLPPPPSRPMVAGITVLTGSLIG